MLPFVTAMQVDCSAAVGSLLKHVNRLYKHTALYKLCM